jgi:hypothetical protein
MVESIYCLQPAWCGNPSCRPMAGTRTYSPLLQPPPSGGGFHSAVRAYNVLKRSVAGSNRSRRSAVPAHSVPLWSTSKRIAMSLLRLYGSARLCPIRWSNRWSPWPVPRGSLSRLHKSRPRRYSSSLVPFHFPLFLF